MINKKALVLFCSAFLSLFLTSCYVAGGDNADFPRHRCNSIEQVRKQIPSDILLPNFKSMKLPKGDFSFFTVNLPGPVVTGYSVEINNISTNDSLFKKAEFRGIKTSIKGVLPEGFDEKNYSCIIKNTPIKISGRDCFYSAFTDKVYTQSEISEQKGFNFESSKPIKNNQNIKYFYIYTQNDEIRYSVTFSEFRGDVGNDEIEDVCLEIARQYQN